MFLVVHYFYSLRTDQTEKNRIDTVRNMTDVLTDRIHEIRVE